MIDFGTKAETLEAVREKLQLSQICPSLFFTVEKWRDNPSTRVNEIQARFPNQKLIMRSSAIAEDSAVTAMAGMHDSVANVSSESKTQIESAINRVIQSYEKSKSEHLSNQILIQPMVTSISMSGVVFTRDLNSGAPYYVINYDDETGKTDTVTSGNGDTNRTLYVHRGHWKQFQSARFFALLSAIHEIETLVESPIGLDIEFAVTKNKEIYIFQVRRLTVQNKGFQKIEDRINQTLDQVVENLELHFAPQENLLGKTTVFAEMSDWNPAEMIGTAPRKLAFSLYRYLITDSVWAEARAEMGYRNLTGLPPNQRSLMTSFCGRPFIDVRKSLNSFLPESIENALGEKLINYWIERLGKSPDLHDKIEFDVATTIYSPDFDRKVHPELLSAGFSDNEVQSFRNALLQVTDGILNPEGKLLDQQFEFIGNITHLMNSLSFQNESTRELLDHCKAMGTKPFAMIARCGFVAEQMLRALIELEVLPEKSVDDFKKSIHTVLSDFLEDLNDYAQDSISKEIFFEKYGHLRPGTYNILSRRYDRRADLIKNTLKNESATNTPSHPPQEFNLDQAEDLAINQSLKQAGLDIKAKELLTFIEKAIRGREWAKLEFTKILSFALEQIADWGTKNGISREEVSHLSIDEILEGQDGSRSIQSLRKKIETEQKNYEVTQAVKLPYLIQQTSDAYIIPLLKSRPNFITHRSVSGPVHYLGEKEESSKMLEGKIVLIESADPGFDWIFSAAIRGLATKYGGANSHMAIRCAELEIPAAIGCGEQIFDLCINSTEVVIDCESGLIYPSY